MKTTIQRFQEQVEKHRNAIALRDPAAHQDCSYGRLDENARRVAAKLIQKGLKPGDAVIITAGRGIGYIEAILGILMAGGAYVPLSDHYPEERIRFIREDCGARMTADDAFLEAAMLLPPIDAPVDAAPDEIALVAYTSGSTGRPKGVVHTHQGMAEAVARYTALVAPAEQDVYAINAPFYFIFHVEDTLGCLTAGITAVIVPDALRGDPASLADLIDANGISMIYLPPKVLRYFRRKGDSLRLVVSGSERISGIAPEGYQLIALYGSTETVGSISDFRVDRAYDNTPIGKPGSNCALYLLDEEGQPGDEGEICVAGHLGRGYLNLQDESAQTFVTNPFQEQDGFDLLIHTGDLGRRLPDGNIQYLNRKDWMVKINGQRVEPGEIEAVIRHVKGVSDAAVKDFENAYSQTYLCAYYVAGPETAVTEAAIREGISAKLPDYMMPSFFVRMERLPVNANGKLDRRALEAPNAATWQEAYAAPQTGPEKLLCHAMADLLGLDRVGLDDDFFRIGGDSVKAIMMASACQPLSLSVAEIYEHRTPRKMADACGKREAAGQHPASRPERFSGAFPLTASERSMYIEQMTDPESTEYNLHLFFHLHGIAEDSVEAALREILAAHEAFHSFYANQDGVPVRILVGQLPGIERRRAPDLRTARSEVLGEDRPFDLSGVPVRIHVYQLASGALLLHIGIHHIAFDGGSLDTLVSELWAHLNGETPEAAPVDLSDLADRDHTEEISRGLVYYREIFRDGVPRNEMPVRGVRPQSVPAGDRERSLHFDADWLQTVESAARAAGVTVFQFLFAAVSMVLGVYCGSEDLVLGVPANTRDTDSGRVIGMFVNMAPVRVKPVPDKLLRQYLNEVCETVHAATRTACLPFADVVREFAGDRDDSRHPIFDVSVNYLHTAPSLRKENRALETEVPLQRMKRDMGITIQRGRDELTLTLQYSNQLYDDALIGRFLDQFRATVAVMCGSPDATLREATALPDQQAAELETLSVSAVAETPDKLLHGMFERIAVRYPDRTALIAGDAELSYAELNARANQVAWALAGRGVGRGDRVLLLLPRRSFYFAAMFGVMKAGAAFIPCDPEYPAERILSILADSDAACLITTGEHLTRYADHRALDILTLLQDSHTANPDLCMTGDDLAYMIYTSGSTGKPKGVMLRHAGICNYLTPHPANLQFDLLSRTCNAVLSVTTVAFDMSLKETTGALCNGKTLVFASEQEMNDPIALTALFARTGADCFNATPSRLQQYLEYKPFCQALAKRKLVMCGGEGYPKALLERLKALLPPDAHIVNTYGPTEITVSCNGMDLTKAERVSVGRPLLNVREYIVGAGGGLVPRGVVGELYIGGPGVAKGYRNLEEQTARSFVNFHGGRFYRSGDWAKWDEEGNIVILGRMDGQVKLRGLRIELGEIESVLMSCPGVREAVARVWSTGGSEYLAAYYTADTPLDADSLKAFVSEKLTHYMVPSAFVQLDSIPVTGNGKANRKALPEPAFEPAAEDRTPPGNATEQKLFDIVSGIVGTRLFGVRSTFTDLGLTSLTLVSLMLKTSEAFGQDVTLADLRAYETVEALAGKLDQFTKQEKPREILKKYPLTQTQYGIYVECLANPGTTIYNIPTLWKLDPSVDLNRLRAAVARTLDAHPYTKARLEDADGQIFALRDDAKPAGVEVTDLSAAPVPEQLLRPFDLLRDALVRAEIFRTPEGNFFYLDMHHIASDGRSRALLVRDIEAAYAGESVGTERFTGYEAALDESERRSGPQYDQAKAWYERLLSDAQPTELPPVPGDGAQAGFEEFVTDVNAGAVLKFCQDCGVTANAFFNAVFGYTLGVFAATRDTVFTTVYDGRNDSRVFNTVTMLVKTLPVRCRWTNETRVRDFLRETRDQLNESMNSDLFSFAEIAHAYGVSADFMVAWQDEMQMDAVFCGAPAEIIRPVSDTAKSALSIDVQRREDRIAFFAEHRPETCSAGFVLSFMQCMAQVAREFLIRDTLGDVSPVSAETERALMRFHDTDWPVIPRPAYRLLQDSAKKVPERIAVIGNGVRLTYAELNARANRMARLLIEKGIGVEKCCAVMLHRGVEVYVARQGVLKAGGAFLPIDPEYPDDRVAFILQDADCGVIITSRLLYQERSALFTTPGLQVCFAEDAEDASIPSGNPDLDVPFDALAYSIYTSGSTGRPKGVLLTQRNLVSFVDGNPKNREILGYIERGHVSLALASIAFDVSVMEEFIPLAHGLTVVIANDDERYDHLALRELCLANAVDILTCTPSLLANLLDDPAMRPMIRNLKSIDTGAEAFPAALYHRIREQNPDVYIMNGYGPTEATISCTMAVMDGGPVTIGIPNSNVKAVMLDETGHILPIGALGELTILGEGVGRGYRNREEQTAKSFIRLWDRPAYRSGDLARLLPNGNIEFRGRTDNQVKLRGLRIELDEIENVILSCPGVRLCKILMRNNGTEDYLAGFFTADRQIPAEELTRFMKERLTAYMIPDVMQQLETMPLTVNGKIDARRLPDVRFVREQTAYVPPENETEKAFCDRMAEILNLPRVGAEDDFFEIGGTSLSAMSLVSFGIGQGWDLVYRNVFEYTTPRALAAFVRKAKEAHPEQPCAAEPAPEPNPAPVPAAAFRALAFNTPSHLDGIESKPLGSVLLTGGTGFLGVHTLRELLVSGRADRILCLVRGKKTLTAEDRLKVQLEYYFNDTFDSAFRDRIHTVSADVTSENLSELLREEQIDTIINCAAVVKHFAQDDRIERVNEGGVLRLTEIALQKGARLIQVSTESVAGQSVNGSVPEDRVFTERDLDIGQTLGTKYTQSKYNAEAAILRAIDEKGLHAKIVRVGNLMGRRSDGEFQINFTTNGFMNRLKAYVALGCFPVEDMDVPVEFSPIDFVAKALVLLSGTADPYTVFHADNCHVVHMANIIEALDRCGMKLDVVPENAFAERLHAALGDEHLNLEVSSLLSYRTNNGQVYRPVACGNAYTVKALYRLGFSWPVVTPDYIEMAIRALKSLGFFDL